MKAYEWAAISCWLLFFAIPAALQAQVDDFDEDPLANPDWEYYEPVPGPLPSTADGSWRMTLPTGVSLDHWVHVDSSPQLRRSDFPEDFIISTRLHFQGSGDPENPSWPPPNEPYQAGLMIYFGDRDVFYWGPYRGAGLVLERSGSNGLCSFNPGLQELSLMVTKSGPDYTFAWRASDDDSWQRVCAATAQEPPLFVGLIFKTWANLNTEETFDFDYFSIEEVPESPPEIHFPCEIENPDTAWIGMPYIRRVEPAGQPRPTLTLLDGPEGLAYDPGQNTLSGWTPENFDIENIDLEASGGGGASAINLEINVEAASSIRDDDFDDDPAFDGDWEFHEPQPGIAYSIVEEEDGNSWWRMEVPVTGNFGQNFDTWTGVDRAPQLRRAIDPDLDFLIETRVRIVPDPAPPAASPFLAGLVLYYGGTDIIHWNIGQQRTINGQPTNLFLERSGINNIGHGWADGLLQGEAVRLRIEKRCDSYHFFYRGAADPIWTHAQTITTPTPLESIGLVMKTWGGGASFTADFDYFDIVEAGPRAAFTVDPEEGQEPLTVTVDASASTSPNGVITAYSWDFGDGAAAEGVTSEHTYQNRGVYTIRLDVTDESGDQGQAANTVRAAFRSDGIAPWTLQNIGEPPPAIEGGARLEGDACLRVLAGGTGIRSRSDQFSFAYQQLPTSGPFIARIGEAAWAGRGRIGLMIREDLDPDSRFAAIVFADTGFRGLRYSFLRREEKAGIVRTTNSPENFEVGDAWIRLEYEAGEIIGSWSVDRKNWTELYRAVFDLQAEAYVGIASTVQSLGEGDEFEATLCDISTGTDNPPPPPPEICGNGIDDDENGLADCLDPQCAGREECLEPAGARLVRGDSNSDGSINLTDGVIPLIFLFSGGAPPACMDSADANDTGNIEITDAIIIFSWLFTGGAPPAPPTPSSPGYPAEDCGIDDTEDGLGCETPTRVCD